MINTLIRIKSEEKERFTVPRRIQRTVPVRKVYGDGMFLCGKKYSKSYRFSDINYRISSDEDRRSMFLGFMDILNGIDSDAEIKITVYNRVIDKATYEKETFLPMKGDSLDALRKSYNEMLAEKIISEKNIIQEKIINVSAAKKSDEEARVFFKRVFAELASRFKSLGTDCEELTLSDRLKILHDFYRKDDSASFRFDLKESMRKGHDFKDYISADSLEMKKDHFILGNKFGRALYLREYASYIRDSLITDICDMGKTMMLSVTLNPVPMDEAVREVEKRLLGVDTNIANWQRRQNRNNNFSAEIPYDLAVQREEAKEFLNDLTNRDQKMMFAVFSIVHLADSLEELNADTKSIILAGRTNMCEISPLNFRQLEGLNTTLPVGVRKINTFRTLTTESAAAVAMPFSVREISHRGGIYYGINRLSGNMIIADRRNLLNGNGFFLGVPGSGKSFMAKKEILSLALASDDEIIVIDPEREYSPLISALGGEIIPVSSSSEFHINAMDMGKDYDEANPVSAKSEFVMSLCEVLMGDRKLTAQDKSVIDRCVGKVYEPYIKRRYKGTPPTLKELYDEISRQSESCAQDIALSLEMFVNGNLNTFSKQTNVNTDSRIISFDIFSLGSQLKGVGMLIVLDFILNRITSNRKKGKNTHIFIDELYLLFEHEYSANFLSHLWKRVRKYGALATGISQNADEILRSPTATNMLANSEFIVMLNQAPTDRIRLSELLNISPKQQEYITNAPAGCGLMKVGNSMVPFRDDFPENELYKLLTTKFGETQWN
ncbi:MAG: ATP-binding protein [Eubacteriaceae bacterium]|nr:ATP-binding protein [Eubacteriaceae bacterium]